MARTLEDLRSALNEARAIYGGQFAGQPRVTRSTTRLDELIGRVVAVRTEASELGTNQAFLDECSGVTAGWAEEKKAIQAAQTTGTLGHEASSHGQWIRDCIRRYERNFAGKSRQTRDVVLLQEVVEQLGARLVAAEVFLTTHTDDDLRRSMNGAQNNLDVYRTEVVAIKDAQREGPARARAGRMGTIANQQFQRYRLIFAGQPRLPRRPQVLAGIVDRLEDVHADMLLMRGVDFPSHEKNMSIVADHLATYRSELAQIRDAQSTASFSQRGAALADAANDVFTQYRKDFPGHSRSTRDEDKLSDIWEQLWPIALEMEHNMLENDAEPGPANLQKVRDTLRLYEREHSLICDAKK
ncbi:MAG: hypothetical protein ACI9MC_000688 [Kiritimatiellia bacterium]|jgi:hypothetical protein